MSADALLTDRQIRVDRRDELRDVADVAGPNASVGGWDLVRDAECVEVLTERLDQRRVANTLLVADAFGDTGAACRAAAASR